MARRPRLVVPGVPVHLIQRGNNRARTFHSARDFECYLDGLYRASRQFECAIHAYALMTNHVHLLATPQDDMGLSRMMQMLGRRYVRYVNNRTRRTGTLWEGRFKSTLIDSERYFFACSRYIELNPVRAQMVEMPAQYRWSSHRHNAHGDADRLVTPHPLYEALAPTVADRRAAYRGLFDTPLDPATLDRIRRDTNRGVVLGDDSFLDRLEQTLARGVRVQQHGGDRRSVAFQQL